VLLVGSQRLRVSAEAFWLDEPGEGVTFASPNSRTFARPVLGHKDVGGFDVVVDNALGVRGVEGVGHLNRQSE
jgi:hypothetical protein